MKEQKAIKQNPKGVKTKTGKTNGSKTTHEEITVNLPPTPSHQPEIVGGQIVPVKKSRPPGSGKKPGKLGSKTERAVELCLTTGISVKDAYTLANGKPPTPPAATRLKQQVEKYSLQRPVMQKLAHQALRDTLEGKEARYDAVKVFSNGAKVPYQEVIAPSYTNKLAAAAMIYDRVDPLIRRSENLNVNVDCSPVDLEKYRNR